jgi:hypothetical protein
MRIAASLKRRPAQPSHTDISGCLANRFTPKSGRPEQQYATDPVARRSLGNPYQRFGSAEERDRSIELISVPFPTRLHLP